MIMDDEDDQEADEIEDDDGKRRFPMTEGEFCPADPDPVTGRCDALVGELRDAVVAEISGVDRPAIARGFTRFKRLGGCPNPEPPSTKEESPMPAKSFLGRPLSAWLPQTKRLERHQQAKTLGSRFEPQVVERGSTRAHLTGADLDEPGMRSRR